MGAGCKKRGDRRAPTGTHARQAVPRCLAAHAGQVSCSFIALLNVRHIKSGREGTEGRGGEGWCWQGRTQATAQKTTVLQMRQAVCNSKHAASLYTPFELPAAVGCKAGVNNVGRGKGQCPEMRTLAMAEMDDRSSSRALASRKQDASSAQLTVVGKHHADGVLDVLLQVVGACT